MRRPTHFLPLALLLVSTSTAAEDVQPVELWYARLTAWYNDSFRPMEAVSRPSGVTRFNLQTLPQGHHGPMGWHVSDDVKYFCDLNWTEGAGAADSVEATQAFGPHPGAYPERFEAAAILASFATRGAGWTAAFRDFQIEIAELPAGYDPRMQFQIAAVRGCIESKAGAAYLWTTKTFVMFTTTCGQSAFGTRIASFAEALERWEGVPVSWPIVYSPCGTMAPRFVEREALLRSAW